MMTNDDAVTMLAETDRRETMRRCALADDWRSRCLLILDRSRVLTPDESAALCAALVDDATAPGVVRDGARLGCRVHGEFEGTALAVRTAEYWILRACSLAGVGLSSAHVGRRGGADRPAPRRHVVRAVVAPVDPAPGAAPSSSGPDLADRFAGAVDEIGGALADD
jgi:hypothetical protein